MERGEGWWFASCCVVIDRPPPPPSSSSYLHILRHALVRRRNRHRRRHALRHLGRERRPRQKREPRRRRRRRRVAVGAAAAAAARQDALDYGVRRLQGVVEDAFGAGDERVARGQQRPELGERGRQERGGDDHQDQVGAGRQVGGRRGGDDGRRQLEAFEERRVFADGWIVDRGRHLRLPTPQRDGVARPPAVQGEGGAPGARADDADARGGGRGGGHGGTGKRCVAGGRKVRAPARLKGGRGARGRVGAEGE